MEIQNKFFIDKFKAIYIILSSLLIYFIVSFAFNVANVYIAMILRAYYIFLSIVLFTLLNQIREYYDKYIFGVIWLFLIEIIGVSLLCLNYTPTINNLEKTQQILEFSSEIIILAEVFTSYAISEYCLKNKKIKKRYWILLIFSIIYSVLSYHFNDFSDENNMIYALLKIPFIISLILNLRKSENIKTRGWNTIYLYTILIFIIQIINIFNSYIGESMRFNMITELMYLINFRIVWHILIANLIREPYKHLSKSLNKENYELDRLNLQIVLKNKELEKSINILKEKEYLNYTFFRFMPNPIIILNSENNRILFVNKQFLKLTGALTSKDFINKKVKKYIEFIPKEYETNDYNAILYIDNKRKFLKTTVLDKYSYSDRKLILIKDNTSKVENEEIRKEIEEKINEEHMRAQFLSSISHDLKTPINVIYSASQVEKIYIKKEDMNSLEKYNSISSQNCVSLIKLTNNLIDNSQIKSHFLTPNLEKLNLIEIVEDNVMALVDYAKWSNIELIFDTDIEECEIMIDAEFMKRIILNLVSNAVKFTPPGGKIFICISSNDQYIEMEVRDTGSGIEDDFVDKAFNRYMIGEKNNVNSKCGSGIGLFVVKQLVELQNGEIHIKKDTDIGTDIVVRFNKGESVDEKI